MEVDLTGVEPETFPTDFVENGARWLLWQYNDDEKYAWADPRLPEGVMTLTIDLSSPEWPDAELEMYSGRRYTTITGDHVPPYRGAHESHPRHRRRLVATQVPSTGCVPPLPMTVGRTQPHARGVEG